MSEAEAGPGEAQVNVARGKWGKMERGSSATFGWPWLVGRGSEEAGPWRGRPAEVLVRRGGALATMVQGGRAWELPGNELKLTGGSIWVESRPSR